MFGGTAPFQHSVIDAGEVGHEYRHALVNEGMQSDGGLLATLPEVHFASRRHPAGTYQGRWHGLGMKTASDNIVKSGFQMGISLRSRARAKEQGVIYSPSHSFEPVAGVMFDTLAGGRIGECRTVDFVF
jgi:hypothetical protein